MERNQDTKIPKLTQIYTNLPRFCQYVSARIPRRIKNLQNWMKYAALEVKNPGAVGKSYGEWIFYRRASSSPILEVFQTKYPAKRQVSQQGTLPLTGCVSVCSARLLLDDVVDRVAAAVAVDLEDQRALVVGGVGDPDREVRLVVADAVEHDLEGDVGVLGPAVAEVVQGRAVAVDDQAAGAAHVVVVAEVLDLGLGATDGHGLVVPGVGVGAGTVAVQRGVQRPADARAVGRGHGGLPVLVGLAVAVVVDRVDAGVVLHRVGVDVRVAVVAVTVFLHGVAGGRLAGVPLGGVAEAVGVRVGEPLDGVDGIAAVGVAAAVVVDAVAADLVGELADGRVGVVAVTLVLGLAVAVVVDVVGVGLGLALEVLAVAVLVDAVVADLGGAGVHRVVAVVAVALVAVAVGVGVRGSLLLGLVVAGVAGVLVARLVLALVVVLALAGGLVRGLGLVVTVAVDAVAAHVLGTRVDAVVRVVAVAIDARVAGGTLAGLHRLAGAVAVRVLVQPGLGELEVLVDLPVAVVVDAVAGLVHAGVDEVAVDDPVGVLVQRAVVAVHVAGVAVLVQVLVDGVVAGVPGAGVVLVDAGVPGAAGVVALGVLAVAVGVLGLGLGDAIGADAVDDLGLGTARGQAHEAHQGQGQGQVAHRVLLVPRSRGWVVPIVQCS